MVCPVQSVPGAMCTQYVAGARGTVRGAVTPSGARVATPAAFDAFAVGGDAPRLPDLSGQLVGARHRLLRPLGKRVTLYRAERRPLGERALVRVLPLGPGRDAPQRFLRAASAAAGLHHGHIAHVTDFGVQRRADGSSVAYMAMECLAGENLTTTLARRGPLHWTRVLTIAGQVCRALIVAHDRGVVHGDIKPANCFRVAGRAAPDFIKLLDFGTAELAATASRADDLRAVGVLMYRLLTNRLPEAPRSLRRRFPTLEISPAFEAVVLAALSLDPQRRPASARALYRALMAAQPAPLVEAPATITGLAPLVEAPATITGLAPLAPITGPAPASATITGPRGHADPAANDGRRSAQLDGWALAASIWTLWGPLAVLLVMAVHALVAT
jgi:serine/threonine protein kinase